MGWTKRQRIEAVFNGEQPDRVPIYDILFNDNAIEYYSGKKLTQENGYETVCEAVSACLDMTRDIFGPFLKGIRTDDRGYTRKYERWMTWIIGYPFADHDGMIRFIKDEIDRLKTWEPDSSYIDEFTQRTAYTQELIKETVNISVCPNMSVNKAIGEFGLEELCLLIYDEPELLDTWLKVSAIADLRRVDKLADYKKSPVCLIYADVAQKGGLIFSLEFLQKYLIPEVSDVCDLLHSKGIKVIFHSDGDITRLLPDLVKAGVDGLNPLEIAAGVDIRAIKEQYGRKFIICGGMDITKLMTFGTKDEVVQATKDLIKLAGSDYGLCLGSTTELGWDIPLENVRAMIETTWEYGKYPLK